MISVQTNPSWTGLQVYTFKQGDIQPLMPLLTQEFPNWPLTRIKSYMNLVTTKENDVAGILVSKNEANYYVGLLIYTFQQIDSSLVDKDEKKCKSSNILVIENLIASSLILQNQVFLSLVEKAIIIAKKCSCDFLELPKIDDEGYNLTKEKYKNIVINTHNFRTYLRLK